MNTPVPSKISSKYLSPCRTLGLKRKSSSRTPVNLKLLHNLDTCSRSPDNESHHENIETQNISQVTRTPKILNSKKHLIKRSKPLECVKNIVPHISLNCEKAAESNKSFDKIPESQKPVLDEEANTPFGFIGFVAREDIVDLLETINLKIAELKRLKRTQIYSKIHNLNDLRQSTTKWKEACKEVVLAIQDELKSKGQDVPLTVILKEHNIPFESIGFNEESMDFDC